MSFIQATVYKTGSVCAAFLANVGTQSDATMNFNGNSYHLPAWSVSILPDCKNVVLNTAKVCLMSFFCIFVDFGCSRFPWFLVDAQITKIFCARCGIVVAFSQLDLLIHSMDFPPKVH